MNFLEWLTEETGTLSEKDLRHIQRIVNHVVQPILLEVLKMNATAQKLSSDIDALQVAVAELLAKPAPSVPATDEELAAMDAKILAIKEAVSPTPAEPAV